MAVGKTAQVKASTLSRVQQRDFITLNLDRVQSVQTSILAYQRMQSFSTTNTGNPLNKFSKLSQEEAEILEKLRYDPDYNPSKDQMSQDSKEYKAIVKERAQALKQLEKYKQSENIIKMINDRLKTA